MSGTAIDALTILDEPVVNGLADLLVDALDGGASVSFLAPLARDDAAAFWRRQTPVAPRGAVLVARGDGGSIDGCVVLAPAWAPNQPHRADIAKLLVHRRARRRGIASALMRAVEAHARAQGFELLVLDTERGSAAEALYRALGWIEVGVIPRYAMFADGRPCDSVVFYKALAPATLTT